MPRARKNNCSSSLGKSKHRDATCGELDRERQAVKSLVNLDDQRGVRIGQREVFDDLGYTLDEQQHGGKSRRLGGRQPGRRLRAAERSEAVLVLTRYPRLLPFTQFNETGRPRAAISGVTHNAYREG
jgi:hypothetical protein